MLFFYETLGHPYSRLAWNVVIKAEVRPAKCVWCSGIVASSASKSLAPVTKPLWLKAHLGWATAKLLFAQSCYSVGWS